MRPILLGALAILALGSPAQAQEATTGVIQGRVLNATNGKYVGNVVLTVEGTALEALSDDYGYFQLRNVPAGTVTLKAVYTGETAQSVTLTVLAGKTTTEEVRIGRASNVAADGSVVLDSFQVAADRFKDAREIAINEERQSVNIKNVVAADQFGDIPGGNIGEFVKFLPGVQVSYGAFGGASSGYADKDATGVSVRGFGPEDTAILINGLPVSNAAPGSLSRQVGLDMLSVNNASRVELIKVATPDMPNNSAGGQINLITKSAFEYARPTYSGRIFFNFNSLYTSLKPTVGPANKNTYKTTPGGDFTVAYPISRTLGISVTGFGNREFNLTYRATPQWTSTGIASSVLNSGGNAVSLANPTLNRIQITESPSLVDKTSANVTVDWKPTPNQLVTVNGQLSTYTSVEAQRRLDMRPTVAATPAAVNGIAGTAADWGPTFTTGTNANSTFNMTATTIDKIGNTASGQIQYRLRTGGWTINAGGSVSASTGHNRDRANGHYSGIDMQLNAGQVNFANIASGIPGSIQTFRRTSAGGGAVDYTQLSNWAVSNTIAQSGQADSRNVVSLFKLDVERALDFIPWINPYALTFKTGVRRDVEFNHKSGLGTGYREVLDTGKTFTTADVTDTAYVGRSPGFGQPAQQWVSTYKLYQLNQANRLFVAPTDGTDAVNNYNSYVNQQKKLTDTRDALYAMLSGKFFRNRLSFVGGLRFEQEARKGNGPFTDNKWNYLKNPDGTLYRDSFYKTGVTLNTGSTVIRTNADGTTTSITNFLTDPALLARLTAARIAFPDHQYGPIGTSLESRKLQLIPLHAVDTTFRGKPAQSLSGAFNVTANLVLKAAWSRSFSLPPLESATNGLLSGNGAFTINENDVIPADGTKGTIAVANPNLEPSISNNWDFDVSYYTKNGGKLSTSYYYKTVTNQPVTYVTYSDSPAFNTILDAIGLDPAAYRDWKLTTATNSTTSQKVSGFEFAVQQDLRFLGNWGRHFSTFATFTLKKAPSVVAPAPVTVTSPSGVVTTITPTVQTIALTSNRAAGAGLQFVSKRISAQIRGTFRNDNEDPATTRVAYANGNFLRGFQPAEKRVDVNASYRFSSRYSFFVSGKDVFNGARKLIKRDDLKLLPNYAQIADIKKFGITWTVGITGSF